MSDNTARRRAAGRLPRPAASHLITSVTHPPLYRRLARKEARLREDQFIALSRLVRVLTRRRISRSGPRLTENTLIRVAIDVLLERADRLVGDTETELRASVLDRSQATPKEPGPALFELDTAGRADDATSRR